MEHAGYLTYVYSFVTFVMRVCPMPLTSASWSCVQFTLTQSINWRYTFIVWPWVTVWLQFRCPNSRFFLSHGLVGGWMVLNFWTQRRKRPFVYSSFCFFFCFLFRHRSRSNSYLTFTAALSYSKYNKFGLQGLWTIEYIRAFHGIARGFFFRFVGFAHAHAFLWHSRFYSMTHESQDLQSAHQRQPWPQTPSLVLDLCLCLWGSGLLFKLQDDVDFFYIPLAAIVILSKVYPWRLTGCFVCGNLRIESECWESREKKERERERDAVYLLEQDIYLFGLLQDKLPRFRVRIRFGYGFGFGFLVRVCSGEFAVDITEVLVPLENQFLRRASTVSPLWAEHLSLSLSLISDGQKPSGQTSFSCDTNFPVGGRVFIGSRSLLLHP